MNFNHTEDMTKSNQQKHQLALQNPKLLEEEYEQYTKNVLADPRWFLNKFLVDQMTDADKQIALSW